MQDIDFFREQVIKLSETHNKTCGVLDVLHFDYIRLVESFSDHCKYLNVVFMYLN